MSHRAIGAPAARPLVFAHRGGAALAPENTIAAFDRGLACGADGLELDVRLARDGVPVVIHDATLERTTDAVGPVAAYDAAALSRVDAAWWFAPERGYPLRGTGIGVPRLEDVIARYPDVPLLVELKDASPVLADRVVELLAAAGALGRAAVGSFALEAMRRVRAAAPALATAAAPEEIRTAVLRARVGLGPRRPAYRLFAVPEHWSGRRIVSPRFVRAAHRGGLLVYVWTVDEEPDMRRLLAWGVDGLITDRPDVAVRVVRSALAGAARA